MRCQLLFAALLANVLAGDVSKSAPFVTIPNGAIEGVSLPSKVQAFLGIPFAQSPPERFSAPKEPRSWTSTLMATRVKPACIQEFGGTERIQNFTKSVFASPMPEESEDCLYLNIWVPAGEAPEGGWPVMFWIHGGNLQFGTAGMPLYDGSNIAKTRDIVVVGVNYRTNG